MERVINRQRGGKRPGAGRKSNASLLGISDLLNQRLTVQKREKIIDNLFKFATGSNPKAAVAAAGLLLAYAYGKPTEKHEVSNPDGSPLLQPVAEAMVKVYGSGGSQ
jgi:hypothetical protein